MPLAGLVLELEFGRGGTDSRRLCGESDGAQESGGGNGGGAMQETRHVESSSWVEQAGPPRRAGRLHSIAACRLMTTMQPRGSPA